MVLLDLSYNKFTGPIPKGVSQYSDLVHLSLAGNKFSGGIQDLFNASVQKYLQNFDVTDNIFSGTIPGSMFKQSGLSIFAVGSNCLRGSIPPEVCYASNLTILALDGMSSQPSCRTKIFPYTSINTYRIRYSHGSIPSCVFSLDKLQVLHLSGNGMSGSIPSDVTLGASLVDMTLSNNFLRGFIPPQVQLALWRTIDLSHNSFDGTLSKKLFLGANSSLDLIVNRLSGDIPSNVVHAPGDMSVLDGNLFRCQFDSNKLPRRDPNRTKYSCGSDAFELSVYLWLGIAVLLIFVYARTACSALSRFVRAIIEYKSTGMAWQWLGEVGLDRYLQRVWLLYACIAAAIILGLLPTFGAVSEYSSTHSYEYAWTVSAAYLSGRSVGVVLIVFWTFLLLLVRYLYGNLNKAVILYTEAGVDLESVEIKNNCT